MDPSENKKINEDNTESKPLPAIDDRQSRSAEKRPINNLTVNTENIEQPSNNRSAITATPMTSASRQQQFRPRRMEIPTDTRPDRTQRPEDLKRAQYLGTNTTTEPEDIEKDGRDRRRKKKNSRDITCWRIFSRVMTWWAFPFLLKRCGKQ